MNFFENFAHSVAASRVLLAAAHKNGALLEALVLYASVIDALLRNLVALETGDRDGYSITLDSRYFYHDPTKWMNERKIYAEARSCGVLSDSELAQLEDLYKFRNIAIHRFIISNVTYTEIGPKLEQYEVIYTRLLDQLREIEQPDGEEIDAEREAAMRRRVARKIRADDPESDG